MTDRICDECGKHLVSHRLGARFCGDECKNTWHNSKRRRLDPAPVGENVPTTLYRLFDSEGGLVYVGITSGNPLLRWKAHSHHQWWWQSVATARLEHFDSRPEAAAAELEAIRSERPSQNQAGVPA